MSFPKAERNGLAHKGAAYHIATVPRKHIAVERKIVRVWSAKVLDPSHPIIELVWSERISADDVDQANKKLEECIKAIGGRPFDLLVDMSKLISVLPEAQRKIVEHQKWLLSNGMKRAAVVSPNAVVSAALDALRKRPNHVHEYKFSTREQALAFLKQ